MQKLSSIMEAYFREEPRRDYVPKSEKVQQIEEFAHNKDKRSELIKAFTELSDHPTAEDMGSDIGSAFDEQDLDEEMQAAFDAVGEGGIIYASFEQSFWVRSKGKLIRVM